MKFKIDENLPREFAEILGRAGHEAKTVWEQDLKGADDPTIISACTREGRVLVTLDLDFSDIRAYPPSQYHGLMVLRVSLQDKQHVMKVFRQAVLFLDREEIDKRLWIVEETRIRIRDT